MRCFFESSFERIWNGFSKDFGQIFGSFSEAFCLERSGNEVSRMWMDFERIWDDSGEDFLRGLWMDFEGIWRTSWDM